MLTAARSPSHIAGSGPRRIRPASPPRSGPVRGVIGCSLHAVEALLTAWWERTVGAEHRWWSRRLGGHAARLPGGSVLIAGRRLAELAPLLAARGAIEIVVIDIDNDWIEAVQRQHPEYEFQHVDRMDDLPEALRGRRFDLVLADDSEWWTREPAAPSGWLSQLGPVVCWNARRGGEARSRRERAAQLQYGRDLADGNVSHAGGCEPMREDSWRGWIRNAPAVTTTGGGGGGRVLLFTYTFPPTGGSGVQRPAKLAKHLSRLGWQVEVIAAGHRRFPWYDASLVDELPPGVRVHRVRGWEPASIAAVIGDWLGRFLPGDRERIDWLEERLYWRLAAMARRLGHGDGHAWWVGAAARHGIGRHRVRPFDAVISTGPPVFVHLAGMRMAAACGLPWIADVRDPLISDFDPVVPARAQISAARRMERGILRRADLVVTTCEALAADLRRRYPRRSPGSIVSITNGFDREDLRAALGGQEPAAGSPETCTFLAYGSFYGRRELTRLVGPIERLLQRRPNWRELLRLVVVGTLDARQERYWRARAPSWLILAGYLDHAASIRQAAAADCTVVMVPECRHTRLCIPGKLFELLALPTHMLALVPAGSETEAIIRRAGAATCVPLEDEEAICRAIEGIVERQQRGCLERVRHWPALDVFDREILAARYADLLAAVIEGRAGP